MLAGFRRFAASRTGYVCFAEKQPGLDGNASVIGFPSI
jgi:hypothetical protein